MAHGKLYGELVVLSGNDFQRKIAPYLRAIFPGIIEAPNLKHIDNSGIDYVQWSDDYHFPVVVQVKGWEVSADNLGDSQIKQCEKSLLSFHSRTDMHAARYIIVHNRDHRNSVFRESLFALLNDYREKGIAENIEVWSLHDFINIVFDAILKRLLHALKKDAQRRFELGLELVKYHGEIEPICRVPISSQIASTDQYKLLLKENVDVKLADPTELILSKDLGTELVLLIGEFGYGKSTAVLRALGKSPTPILFVQGAMLGNALSSTNEFLVRCIDEANVLGDVLNEDALLLTSIVSSVAKYILSTDALRIRLVIDGLDESPLLTRSDGFQTLFNWLKDITVPVVLTMRSEMWNARKESFRVSQYMVSKRDNPRIKRFKLIELFPWSDEQIMQLTLKYCDQVVGVLERERLLRFYDLVESGKYSAIYGDIPRRPLFLHLVLDSVKNTGVSGRQIGRGALFRDWILYKIRRDMENPIAAGGVGRLLMISNYSVDENISTVWDVMVTAAGVMVEMTESQIQLIDAYKLKDIILELGLQNVEQSDLGLYLNSLLVPLSKKYPLESVFVRFAHRAFQEYFLAWYILESKKQSIVFQYPLSVREWVQTLENENIVN